MMTDNAVLNKLQAIPHGLEHYAQFINWTLNGKDKIPVNARGKEIDPHDSKNWMTAAQAAASAFNIGFVFSSLDPFFFIDIDHAIAGSSWSDLAQWVFQWFPGAAFEVSQSGTGAHLFGMGAGVLPSDHRCKRKGLALEVYTNLRFVALTGINRAGSALVDFSATLPRFMTACDLDGVRGGRDEELAAIARDPAYTGPGDDAELVRLMCGSTGSAAAMFKTRAHPRDLWTANADELAKVFPAQGRPDGAPFDRSAADAALMWHLAFWTGRDVPRMERLFQASALYRPEKYVGKGAYRMDKVLSLGLRNEKVYDRPSAAVVAMPGVPDMLGATSAAGGVAAPRQLRQLPLAAQRELFAGCVYVADRHRVMLSDGRLVRPEVFKALFGGHEFEMQADGAKPTRNAFEAFTENRQHQFPKVKSACFRPADPPGAIIRGSVNTWFPPDIDEAEGDISPFLTHLQRLFPVHRDQRIITAYMQACAQNPGVKFQWAPVVQGMEGNGKSLLIRVLARACGLEYSHLPKASEIDEKFNGWIEGNVFVGVEEIYVQDRRKTLDILKDAITNDRIEIRGMGAEKKMADNYTNWFFCTNHQEAIPTDKNQRRYSIFFTPQQFVEDLARDGMTGAYFKKLYDWLNGGGYQAVTWWLRHTPPDPEFNPAGDCQRAPATSSTAEAISASLGPIEQEILLAVEENVQGFRDDWLSSLALDALIQRKGLRNIANRTKSTIIKALGYEKMERCSKVVLEEGGQPRLYRKNGKTGNTADFLIAQGYTSTLRD